jgi:hypothetical protein
MISHFELSIIIGTRNIWLCGCSGILSWHTLHRDHPYYQWFGHHHLLAPCNFKRLIVFLFLNQSKKFSRTRHIGSFPVHKTLSGVIIKALILIKLSFFFSLLLPFSIVFVPAGFQNRVGVTCFLLFGRVRRGGLYAIFCSYRCTRMPLSPHASLVHCKIYLFSTKRCRFIINNGMNSFSTVKIRCYKIGRPGLIYFSFSYVIARNETTIAAHFCCFLE